MLGPRSIKFPYLRPKPSRIPVTRIMILLLGILIFTRPNLKQCFIIRRPPKKEVESRAWTSSWRSWKLPSVRDFPAWVKWDRIGHENLGLWIVIWRSSLYPCSVQKFWKKGNCMKLLCLFMFCSHPFWAIYIYDVYVSSHVRQIWIWHRYRVHDIIRIYLGKL